MNKYATIQRKCLAMVWTIWSHINATALILKEELSTGG